MSSSTVGAAVRRLAIRTALRLAPVRAQVAGRISGIGIHYDRPAGSHRSVGRRVPEVGADGIRIYEALRAGRFVLVDRRRDLPSGGGEHDRRRDLPSGGGNDRTGRGSLPDVADRADRIVTVALDPAPGEPAITLIRPDGYVAWATDQPDAGQLGTALRQWCGPVASSLS
jgi:hypothetical protein